MANVDLHESREHHGRDSTECFLEKNDVDMGAIIADLNSRQRKHRLIISFQWLLLAAFLTVGMIIAPGRSKGTDLVYSPANPAIRYKDVVFEKNFPPMTKYQGPISPETNQAWDDLYSSGVTKITTSEASQLVNKTVPLPEEPGYYMVVTDVFHQLHCLNKLRKKIWSTAYPEYQIYASDDMMEMDHIDHCIDSLRQSLMCHSDVSPVSWSWSEEEQMALAQADTIHTCRDFEAIRDWANERRIDKFDNTIHVPDPLGG